MNPVPAAGSLSLLTQVDGKKGLQRSPISYSSNIFFFDKSEDPRPFVLLSYFMNFINVTCLCFK